MENKRDFKHTPIGWVAISIIVLFILAIVVGIGYFLCSEYKNSLDKGSATIELSTSINQIYLGGRGSIDAVLRYDKDGSIENGNFNFESDRPDLLTFEQIDGCYNGKFKVKDKENGENFSDTKVTVTVSCIDNADIEASSISIVVTDALSLTLNFYNNWEDYYPNRDDKKPTLTLSIGLFQGYSINKINEINGTNFEIPQNKPSDDYDIEWYYDNNKYKRTEITADTVYYISGEINLYAKYRLNKRIKLFDKLFKPEKPLYDEELELYYGESIPISQDKNNKVVISNGYDELVKIYLWQKDTLSNGWTLEGYSPNLNNKEEEKIFIDGLKDLKFCSSSATLYRKWKATVPVDTVFATSNNIPSTVDIVYNAVVEELEDPQYCNGGVLSNWIVKNNDGEDYVFKSGEEYTSKIVGNISAIVKFPIEIDTQGISNIDIDSEYFVEYGKGIECKLPSPMTIVENGWAFDDWYTGIAGTGQKWDEYIHSEIAANESGILNLYAKRTSQLILHRLLDENGLATSDMKVVDVIFNALPDIPFENDIVQQSGVWNFNGYYIVENGIFDGTEREVERDKPYTDVGSQHLYAKWTSSISFEMDSHLGSINEESVNVVYNGKIDCPTVTYLGREINSGDIKFDGWYTEEYGEGDLLNTEAYTLDAGLTFYDKTLINVYFNDTLNNKSNVPVTVIYGKTLSQSIKSEFDGVINLEDDVWTHKGWSYSFEDQNLLEIVTDVNGTHSDKLLGILYIWSDDTPQFNGSIEFDSVWEMTVNYCADIGLIRDKNHQATLRYGEELVLPQLTEGSWSVQGWYIDNDSFKLQVKEDQSDIISTSSNYFKDIVRNNASNRELTLYAMWGGTVVLDFGNNQTKTVNVIYGKPMGNLLPSSDDDVKAIGVPELGFDYPDNYDEAWVTELGVTISNDITEYPLDMDKLVFQWKAKS